MAKRVIRIDGHEPISLTASMQRGLAVVATHFSPRRSNLTDEAKGHVYWQAVDQLEDLGLVEVIDQVGARLRMTPLGWRAHYLAGGS